MAKSLTRREFIKLVWLSLSSLAFTRVFPRQMEQPQGMLGRVAGKQVDVRSLPNDQAAIVGNRFRDQLVHIYGEVRPPDAPKFYNPLWYRVWGGYLHSARIQIVQVRLNEVENYMPPSGQLCEVTVPYTIAYQYNQWDGWIPWRGSWLYYSSVHWVTGVDKGPDGRPWYKITNELSASEFYFVPAEHLRAIKPEEIAPTRTEVAPDKKRVEVSLREQLARLFEGEEVVYTARVSTGIPNPRLPEGELPTSTPEGRFVIYSKNPSKHMGSVAGGDEVEETGGFSLPGVPWASFFKSPGGYALHGTYWHNNFGLQMSHGCVNMKNEDALWLFRWSTPVFDPFKIESMRDWDARGNGTKVLVYS